MSRQSINELVKRAILHVDADGLIDTATARAALLSNLTRPDAKTLQATLATTPAPQSPTPPPEPEPPPSENSYHVARTIRESYEAKRTKLKYESETDRLMSREDAARMAFTAFRSLRDAIQNVPARTKDLLAAETDPFKVEQLLDAELATALTTFDPARWMIDTDTDADEPE